MDNVELMDKGKPKIVLIVHEVRSAHNVGSLLRSANGLSVEHVYLSGYTPYPKMPKDPRLHHLSEKITRQIHKTALGAETANCSHIDDLPPLLEILGSQGYKIVALEQSKNSKSLPNFKSSSDIALVIGNEVSGLDPKVLSLCDFCLEIPMLGNKESFNVAVAAAIALYHLRYHS